MAQAYEEWILSLPPWGIYLIILVTTAIIYQIAFARKLPILKALIVYVVLAIGCFLFFIMQIMGFDMIPSLFIAALLVVLTKIRTMWTRKRENEMSDKS